MGLFLSSASTLLNTKILTKCQPSSPKKKTRRKSVSLRNPSISSQFKDQLSNLMYTINLTKPFYIRCVKPNQTKSPNMLVPDDCLRQLKHAGMMEVVRIRQQGFATREDHDVFLSRHRAIFPSAKTPNDLFLKLETMFQFTQDDFQIGKTKVFLQHGLSDKLEAMVSDDDISNLKKEALIISPLFFRHQ